MLPQRAVHLPRLARHIGGVWLALEGVERGAVRVGGGGKAGGRRRSSWSRLLVRINAVSRCACACVRSVGRSGVPRGGSGVGILS